MGSRFIGFVLILLCMGTLGCAETLDFEGLPFTYPYTPGFSLFQTITTKGYTFSTDGEWLYYNSYEWYCTPSCSTNGSYTLSDLSYMSHAPIVMTAANGLPFTISSFDLSGTFTSLNTGQFTITGNLHGGGTLQEVLSLTVPYNPNPFKTYQLTGWTYLDSVTFSMEVANNGQNFDDKSSSFALDNVVASQALPQEPVAAVPEPGSIVLLCSGAFLVAGRVKRRLLR